MRDLFCLVETAEKPSHAALDQALALARRYGAVASVLIAGPKATAPYTFFNAPTVGDLVQTENEQTLARAKQLAAEARDKLNTSGAKGEVDFCLESFTEITRRARTHALCNDVTVVDRPGGVVEHSEILFEEVLFSAGRPVLLPSADGRPVEQVEKIAVAWDGSNHAARSLSLALGLFEGLKRAEIVVVQGEKDLSGMVPPAMIAAHIQRHGVEPNVAEIRMEKSAAATIDAHSRRIGADLIVMGAFGRSRLREFVTGGVTRDLSRSSSKPLLLAH